MSLRDILDDEEYKALEKIAYQKSKPFCYGCYQEVKNKYCSGCGSDDSIRLVDGYGVEYGLCRIRHKPYYPESQIMLKNQINSKCLPLIVINPQSLIQHNQEEHYYD